MDELADVEKSVARVDAPSTPKLGEVPKLVIGDGISLDGEVFDVVDGGVSRLVVAVATAAAAAVREDAVRERELTAPANISGPLRAADDAVGRLTPDMMGE